MTELVEIKPSQATVRFILDAPADVDFFETHTDVAKAIIRAVKSSPEIKVVGLLGRWGSGKSTVAKTIMTLLSPSKDSGFRVFQYDAWLHQSDPLRRSFLESLIRFLIDDDAAISPTKWTKELERLAEPVELTRTIETPSLALWTLTLLGVPIGLGFLDLSTLKEAFGATVNPVSQWTVGISLALILLPVVTWAGIYLRRRPWAKFSDDVEGAKRRLFWRHLDAGGEPASALQIFEDGQAKHTTTQTFRALEPTSLEFGAKFQDIMREATAGGTRLIILIDNLDRVAADEAFGMWATIRSFFLADHRTDDATHEAYHPTVILPIDRHAIEELLAGSDKASGRTRARSFMDKTFDVTFEVTEPVDSDWRAFWDRQMAWMFGDAYQGEWGFRTRRLFESHLTRVSKESAELGVNDAVIVTPREINKILNRIGALYLQWEGAGIPIDVMALHVIRRDEIDRGLLAFLQQKDAGVSAVAPEWKRQLAALHYGVRVDKAAQVLLEEPIRRAIQGRDRTAIESMVSIPGFGETLEFATANLPAPDESEDPMDILENAVAILEGVPSEGALWTAASWRNLTDRFAELSPTSEPTLDAIQLVNVLCSHAEMQNREPLVELSAAFLSRLLAQPRKSVGDDLRVGAGAENLIAFATAHGLAVPTFVLDLEPAEYVLRVGQLAASGKLRAKLRNQHNGDELGEALQAMVLDKTGQQYAPAVVRALTLTDGKAMYDSDPEIDFAKVAERAEELVRNPETYDAEARPGILILAELSFGRNEGRERLIGLIDDATLTARLNQAADRSDWAGMAEIIAVLMWRGGKFEAPSAFAWWEYPARDPEHPSRILTAVRHYFPTSVVNILWGSRDRNGILTRSFIDKLIADAVERDALGPFSAKPVLEKLTTYTAPLSYKLRDVFIAQVERRADLLETLEQGPLGPQSQELVNYLQRKGGDEAVRAVEIIHQRVETSDRAGWASAIKSGSEPFNMGLEYSQAGGEPFTGKSPLYAAMDEAIAVLANGASKGVLGRWFSLTALLKARARNALFKGLRRALAGSTPDQVLHVMKAGGVSFLQKAGFESEADRSVREIIIPQLDKKDGRTWLKENSDELTGWVQRSGSASREALGTALAALMKSKVEERSYSADILLHQWKLTRPG